MNENPSAGRSTVLAAKKKTNATGKAAPAKRAAAPGRAQPVLVTGIDAKTGKEVTVIVQGRSTVLSGKSGG